MTPAAVGFLSDVLPGPAAPLRANTAIATGDRAHPWARAPFHGGFELRCADAHPVHCDVALRSSTLAELVARGCAHGASAHGFTPVWYTPERVAAMGRAVTTG